jgi:hypothetical protein
MRKLIYGLLMATTLTSPTFAVTAAPVWADEPLRLDDSVLGTWCYTRTDRVEGKSLRVYERNQKCSFTKNWIVVGPNGYRTIDRQCDMVNIVGRASWKNLVLQYRCTSLENDKTWTERAEFGYYVTDHLYIIR